MTPQAQEKMKVLDLFSGIGGFSLGLEATGGFETVAFCEIDPFCQKVLNKHWPDVPIYDDVRTIDYDGPVDLICGGYPCQPFSLAGKREGAGDDRHLWPAMLELVKKHRPAWVIGENVAGHITMGLDDVLSDLGREGYGTRAFVIPACAVGAPHRRDRVWIVANREGERRREAGQHSERSEERASRGSPVLANSKRDEQQQDTLSDGCKVGMGGEATPERGQGASAPSGRSGVLANANIIDAQGKLEGRDDPQDRGEQGERSTGLQSRAGEYRPWPAEPDVGRVTPNGISDVLDSSGRISSGPTPKGKAAGRGHRLRAIGNTVVPQVVQRIGEAILQTTDNQ